MKNQRHVFDIETGELVATLNGIANSEVTYHKRIGFAVLSTHSLSLHSDQGDRFCSIDFPAAAACESSDVDSFQHLGEITFSADGKKLWVVRRATSHTAVSLFQVRIKNTESERRWIVESGSLRLDEASLGEVECFVHPEKNQLGLISNSGDSFLSFRVLAEDHGSIIQLSERQADDELYDTVEYCAFANHASNDEQILLRDNYDVIWELSWPVGKVVSRAAIHDWCDDEKFGDSGIGWLGYLDRHTKLISAINMDQNFSDIYLMRDSQLVGQTALPTDVTDVLFGNAGLVVCVRSKRIEVYRFVK